MKLTVEEKTKIIIETKLDSIKKDFIADEDINTLVEFESFRSIVERYEINTFHDDTDWDLGEFDLTIKNTMYVLRCHGDSKKLCFDKILVSELEKILGVTGNV